MITKSEKDLIRILYKLDQSLSKTPQEESPYFAKDVRSVSRLLTVVEFMRELLKSIEKERPSIVSPTLELSRGYSISKGDSVVSQYRQRIERYASIQDDIQKQVSSGHRAGSSFTLTPIISLYPSLNSDQMKIAGTILRAHRQADEEERQELFNISKNSVLCAARTPSPEQSPKIPRRGQGIQDFEKTVMDTPRMDINDLRRRKQSLFSSKTPSNSKTSKDNQLLLSHNKIQQEQMSDELIKMAFQLKSNSLAFGEKLSKDNTSLDEASQSLSNNIGLVQTQGKTLAKVTASIRSNGCMVYLIILFVLVAFIFTFVFMRIFKK